MWILVYVKCSISLSEPNEKNQFSGHILDRSLNIKCHENPFGGRSSCFIRTEGRTDMTKQIVAFRNFAKTSEKGV